ncbi:hypothetical protein TRIUR3_22728 [Triticum urartu]|uniref:Uncharacterized protein n=1 Tax=Triticum urartu TaxID=4572 RepID=M7YNV2_TRIUA|nr:hypothetical protein TRIUR3_22728 [Triticum urartu]
MGGGPGGDAVQRAGVEECSRTMALNVDELLVFRRNLSPLSVIQSEPSPRCVARVGAQGRAARHTTNGCHLVNIGRIVMA